jgi:predicted DCC family thiol-disulfide oxidoreductase YuxK
MRRIILFDGVCNLCNSSVQFIIQRDPEGKYKFAAFQSGTGLELMKEYHITKELDSIVLIEGNQFFKKSNAAIRIGKNLRGGWKYLGLLAVVPLPIRDFFYDRMAKNRYKWFGKLDNCMLPSPELRSRFLE